MALPRATDAIERLGTMLLDAMAENMADLRRTGQPTMGTATVLRVIA